MRAIIVLILLSDRRNVQEVDFILKYIETTLNTTMTFHPPPPPTHTHTHFLLSLLLFHFLSSLSSPFTLLSSSDCDPEKLKGKWYLLFPAIRYQCMGSWFAMVGKTGYTFAAIADTVEKDRREKFKCLVCSRLS